LGCRGGQEDRVKISDIEVFQVAWSPEDKPAQRSAWVRVHGEDGLARPSPGLGLRLNEAELAKRRVAAG